MSFDVEMEVGSERWAAANLRKRGASFESAAEAFSAPYARVTPCAMGQTDHRR